jgi:hypothetical protein
MRTLARAAITVLWGATLLAQAPVRDAGAALLLDDVSAKLRNELQAIHDKWFQAFDAGDGAAMDAVEVDNLVLVMPDGSVWKKSGSRAGKQPKRDVVPQRSLNDVAVRQFGDTAILTGILTHKTARETNKSGTTVVFVRRGGTWLIAQCSGLEWKAGGSESLRGPWYYMATFLELRRAPCARS